MRKRVKRLLWVMVGCVLALFGVKTFVGDVYRVSSSSMEPALGPDEWVFVLFGSSVPGRYELVVTKEGGSTLVKRGVALPSERVLIDGSGDLRIDGAAIPPEAPRPKAIGVFDDRLHSVDENFDRGGSAGDPWREREGYWELDARELERGQYAGLLRHHKGIHDDWIDSDGKIVFGHEEVHDAIAECEFRAEELRGRFRMMLVEQGDTFELTLDLDREGEVAAQLVRTQPSGTEVLGDTKIHLDPTSWTHVLFANVDNHLRVDVDGETVFSRTYDANSYHASDHRKEGRSFSERVMLGGESCLLWIRGIRISRDLHYTQRGEFGIGKPLLLGPDEIFVLGDNSAASSDSRERGPVKVKQILGRPIWVVWPPSRIRRINGAGGH